MSRVLTVHSGPGKAVIMAGIRGRPGLTITTAEFDSEGNLYAVVSTVVKPIFLQAAQGLPDTPPHAKGIADRELAQQALDTLNQPGGIQMIVDMEPFAALEVMGLSVVPEDEN